MANKVPPESSNAGPGCWQCADCGRINPDDREECRECEAGDQSSLAGYGAGGQSNLADHD